MPKTPRRASPSITVARDVGPAVDFGRVEMRVAERFEFPQWPRRPAAARPSDKLRIGQDQIRRQPAPEEFLGDAPPLRSGEEQVFGLADLIGVHGGAHGTAPTATIQLVGRLAVRQAFQPDLSVRLESLTYGALIPPYIYSTQRGQSGSRCWRKAARPSRASVAEPGLLVELQGPGEELLRDRPRRARAASVSSAGPLGDRP